MSLRFVTTRPGRPTGNQARDQRCQAAPAGTRAAGAEPEHLDGIGLVAMLNDLLQLEHDALEGMGVGRGTLLGAANSAFARFHGTLADGIEGAGRLALEAMARVTRPG
jgi:hypothetical protein